MIIHDLFPIFYQTAIVVNYSNPTNSYLGESLGGSSPESEVTRNHSYFTIYKWEDHNPFTDGNHNSNIGGSMGFRLAIHKWNHPIFMGINHCHGWFTTVPVGWSPCDPKVYEPLLFRRHGFHGFQLHRHRRRITCDASAKGEGFPRDVLSKKNRRLRKKKSLETIVNLS